jgi:hypothetical protein
MYGRAGLGLLGRRFLLAVRSSKVAKTRQKVRKKVHSPHTATINYDH